MQKSAATDMTSAPAHDCGVSNVQLKTALLAGTGAGNPWCKGEPSLAICNSSASESPTGELSPDGIDRAQDEILVHSWQIPLARVLAARNSCILRQPPGPFACLGSLFQTARAGSELVVG